MIIHEITAITVSHDIIVNIIHREQASGPE